MDQFPTAIGLLPSAQLRSWSEIHNQAQVEARARGVSSALDPLDTLPQLTPEQRCAARVALAAYAYSGTEVQDVMRDIAGWSPRLGVLLACHLAREVLPYGPKGDIRLRIAIDTAERWARGRASKDECSVAANLAAYAARDGDQDGDAAAAQAAYAAANAAYAAADAANEVSGTSYAAANAAASAAAVAAYTAISKVTYDVTYRAQRARFCRVIGDVLLSSRGAEWI